MGCDIHLHAEVKIDGEWHAYSAPHILRNYRLFARLAGVRSRDGIKPISDPRGLPEDASVVTKHHSDHWGIDGHSHSWISAEEIALLDDTREEWDYPPGKDSESWMRYGCSDLFGYFYGNSWSGWTKYPEDRPKGIEDVRFVFWFDN